VPNVAEGAAKSGRSASDIAVIVPVMTIVGDSDEERHKERELVRASVSFYGSTRPKDLDRRLSESRGQPRTTAPIATLPDGNNT
jgi:alkanesulfonate monooxygenase SsuD/methylene tetrahydromethanopterin reductase-like flavin-dependent oxidoreductase (luciferase family)